MFSSRFVPLVTLTSQKWDDIAIVAEQRRAFMLDRPGRLGQGSLVGPKRLLPNDRCPLGIDNLELPVGVAFEAYNFDTDCHTFKGDGARQARDDEIRIVHFDILSISRKTQSPLSRRVCARPPVSEPPSPGDFPRESQLLEQRERTPGGGRRDIALLRQHAR